MAGVKDVERKIQGLIDECNKTTGGTATTLSAGVENLSEALKNGDVNLGVLDVTENGSYNAEAAGYRGYSDVNVSVPQEPFPGPEEGWHQLWTLANGANEEDVAEGKEYFDGDGNCHTGTHVCSSDSDTSDSGVSGYFSGTLNVGASAGDRLGTILTAYMLKWRAMMKAMGAEQNYMPMMIGTTTGTQDIFQGAWYAGDSDTEYSYVGHNLMGGSTLKIGYDTTGGKVTRLSMTVDGTAQTIPLGGINAVFAFFWPVGIE